MVFGNAEAGSVALGAQANPGPSVRFPGAHGQKEPLSLNIATSKEV